MPPVVGTVFGGTCCDGVVEEVGGASIFMALDSWGACALDRRVSSCSDGRNVRLELNRSLRCGFGGCWRLVNDDLDVLQLR